MDRLLDTLRALRAPDGCPWDREQTHQTLRPHLLEEAAEAVDALAGGRDAEVVDELGDVLLHVAFHAVIAEEAGRWDYAAVERAITEKLVRRHPHVFSDAVAEDAAAVEATWAAVKAAERGDGPDDHPATRVPRSLPALSRAGRLATALGWHDEPAEAGGDPLDAEGYADALLALAAAAARDGHDPELLLRDAVEARLRDAGT